MTIQQSVISLFTTAFLALSFVSCSDKAGGDNTATGDKDIPPISADLKIAYVNTDTLLDKYDMLKDLEEEMVQEKLAMENQFRQQVEQLEKEYAYAQQESKNYSQEKLQMLQMEFAQKEQNLMQRKQEMEGQLINSEKEKNDRYYAKIREFLDDYAAEGGYHIIYGYNGFGNVLYMHEQYDITDVVVDSLNSIYQQSKEGDSASK